MSLLQMLNTAGFVPAFLMDEAGDEGTGPAEVVTDKVPDSAPDKTPDKTVVQTDVKTALDDDAVNEKPVDKADDWRKRVAGEDETFYKRLQRYPSEADLGKKLTELEKQISKLPPTLPKDATEEEKAPYRKKIGLPDAPEGYEKALRLPEGTVIGEA